MFPSNLQQQAYCQSVAIAPTNYPWIEGRDPTPNDIYYPIGKFWINQVGKTLWYLNSQSNVTGTLQSMWIEIFSVSLLEKLQGNDGNPVSPIGLIIQTLGQTVANGTYGQALYTTFGGSNIENFNIQLTTATGTSAAGNAGVASFNSSQFTVDSNGFVSITNFSDFRYLAVTGPTTYTIDTTSPPNYYLACNTSSGAITIKLLDAPTTFRQFVIKDTGGTASTHNISVTTEGGSITIDGQTTYTIDSNYAAIQLVFNGTNYEVF